jgi:hypothetical protein
MRTARIAGLIAAGAMLLTAAAPVGAADTAMVRVLHGSPDAPSVDVFVDGMKVDALSGAEFGDLTAYVKVPGGTYSIKVCATADNTVCPIGPVDLTFEAGSRYTVAASGLLAAIKADVITDNGKPVDGKAKVKVVHLSADTPAVDVLTQDKSTKLVTNLAYPDATKYLTVAPGSYDLIVCANADNSVCPLDPGALELEDGKVYSVFAIGSLEGGEGVQGLTAVVGVDNMKAPATDTVGGTTSAGSNGGTGLALAALVVAAIAGLAMSVRFAPARIRTRR